MIVLAPSFDGVIFFTFFDKKSSHQTYCSVTRKSMKIFCQECGSRHEYESVAKKPKFCSQCGFSFGAVAAKVKDEPRESVQMEDEEDDSNLNIPRNIRFVIEDIGESRGEDLRSAMQGIPSHKFHRRPISPDLLQRARTKDGRSHSIEVNV